MILSLSSMDYHFIQGYLFLKFLQNFPNAVYFIIKKSRNGPFTFRQGHKQVKHIWIAPAYRDFPQFPNGQIRVR